jgi:hypothetical protein
VSPRQSEAPATLKVPEHSGEVLIEPPVDRIPALLDASRDTSWGSAHILGTPLGEFRRGVRERALALTGIPPSGAALETARGLFVMAHQPLFFHPGVWMKFFLLTRFCQDLAATGLHLIVDTDATGPITAPIPARADRLVRRSETLLAVPDDVPLEAHRPPTEEEWRGFCDRVRSHLATLEDAQPREHFEAFAAGVLGGHRGIGTVGMFLAHLRRVYEARAIPPRYRELAVSALADTPEFRAFALHVLQDPVALRRCYNARLDEYRRVHRLRSAANPVPDLGQLDGFGETPFWVVREGRRMDVFAAREGDRVRLRTAATPLADVPAGVAGVAAVGDAGIRLRPKALMLTMFARLCLGDVFIHGVGGGRYDRVTDAIAEDLFGCPPPPYIVATATLHLSLQGTRDASEDARALQRRLLDLQHNPERFLGTASEDQRRLVDEKWALIRDIEAMRPGPERRAATHRIRELNSVLAAALAPEITRLRERLAVLDQATASRDVVEYREYPFFLFDPAAVAALAGVPPRSA